MARVVIVVGMVGMIVPMQGLVIVAVAAAVGHGGFRGKFVV